MNERGKTWMWSIVVLTLLAVIVVGATLIGVYMTQKHTEAVVEMAFLSKNGEKVHQTVMVNNEKNVAAFYVSANNDSSTVLYDYNHENYRYQRAHNALHAGTCGYPSTSMRERLAGTCSSIAKDIIGFKRMGSQKCYIMDMKTSDVPTMTDILKSIKDFQKQNVTSENDISYSLLEGEEADRTKLGLPINILCSDVPIHWATQNKSPNQRWKFTIKFNIFGVNVSFTFQS